MPVPAVMDLPDKSIADFSNEELKRQSSWWCPPRMDEWFGEKVQKINTVYSQAMTDLTSGHEPPDADCFRYEVEVQGPGRARNLVAVDDEGDPEQPAFKALGALMRTLGLPAPEAAPR